jgi:hypothetical protein
VKVDAAAWQTVVASIYREQDEKDIPQESVPGISPTQESISSQRSIQAFKTSDINAFLSNLKCPFIIFCV